jgi:alpha-tubulin suppressor-like RCC1 family protein
MSACTGQFHIFSTDSEDATHSFSSTISTLSIAKLLPNTPIALLNNGQLYNLQPDSVSQSLSNALTTLNQLNLPIIDCSISPTTGFGIAVTKKQQIWCFGNNSAGELGLSHINSFVAKPAILTKFAQLNKSIRSIVTGYNHSLFLTTDGEVYSTGSNQYFQLGIDLAHTQNDRFQFLPTPQFLAILHLQYVTAISAAGNASAVLTQDGSVYIWGSGLTRQQLATPYLLPSAAIDADDIIIDISLGISHLLLLTKSGRVFSYGYNLVGQLGVENVEKLVDEPVEISFKYDEKINYCTAGPYYSTFINQYGQVYACGKVPIISNAAPNDGQEQRQSHFLLLSKPELLEQYESLFSTSISASSAALVAFSPTRLAQSLPQVINSAGCTHIRLYGQGLFYHKLNQITVQFTYHNEIQTVEGRYNAEDSCIMVETPSFNDSSVDLLDFSGNSLSSEFDSSARVLIRVSLSGIREYSNAIGVFAYSSSEFHAPSSVELSCSHGPFTGRTPLSLSMATISFVPYENIKIRFTAVENEAEIGTVSAQFDMDSKDIIFTAPELPEAVRNSAANSLVRSHIEVALDGENFVALPVEFSYFSPKFFSFSPRECSFIGHSAHSLGVLGLFFTENLEIQLRPRNSTLSVTIPAKFYSQEKFFELLESEKPGQSFQINPILGTNSILSPSESSSSLLSGLLSIRPATSSSYLPRITRPSTATQGLHTNSEVLAQYSELDQQSYGFLSFESPNFLNSGLENQGILTVFVSNNAALNWIDTGFTLSVKKPSITALTPNCGPISSPTNVKVHGQFFYFARPITVRLAQPQQTLNLPPISVELAAAHSSGKSNKHHKGNSRASVELGAEIKPETRTIPAQEHKISADYIVNSVNHTLLSFTTERMHPGNANVAVKFGENGEWLESAVPFSFYENPVILELNSSVASVIGGTEIQLFGSKLFPSADIRVRLILLEAEEPKGAKKASSATGNTNNTGADSAALRSLLPFVEVAAYLVQENKEESAEGMKTPNKKPVKKLRGGKGESDQLDSSQFIQFVCPSANTFIEISANNIASPTNSTSAAAGGADFSVYHNRLLEVDLAMNGQQFFYTGQTIRFELANKSKGIPLSARKQ